MAGPNMQPIIIRRVKKGHGDAHGNTAWKIALADFMTALFIVFLLLWLINQVTPVQRAGIADYFSPASVSRTTSGAGALLSGATPVSKDGAQKSPSAPIGAPGGGPSSPKDGEGQTETPGFPGVVEKTLGAQYGGALSDHRAADTPDNKRYADAERKGNKNDPRKISQNAQELKAVVQDLRQSIQAQPEIKELQQNLLTEITPEGLRIQLVDSEKQELFAKASATPLPQTVKLMAAVAKAVANVPNQLVITGHTDSTPYGPKATYTNWELSTDRANASRRLLAAGGVADARFSEITGAADHDPLFKDDPASPRNRRISIVLLNEPQSAVSSATGPVTNGNAAAAQTQAAAANPPAANAGAAPDGPLIKR